MTGDLRSIGFSFERWQDAVEAAIGTKRLAVTGEVRGGQLIQYSDDSGGQLNILAVEPYATYSGFISETRTFGNVTMVNDVLAYLEVLDPHGATMVALTANLAQGPLIVDDPTWEWAELGVTALVLAYEEEASEAPGLLVSEGAQIVAQNSGAAAPDALAQFSARVLESEYRTSSLSGQRFIYCQVDGAFPFDVCLPDADELPRRDSIIVGTAVMVASIASPLGEGCACGGSCGCS